MGTLSSTEGSQLSGSAECPKCKGAGFVYWADDNGRVDYSRVSPCDCTMKKYEQDRLSRLERYSNLGHLTRFVFDSLLPEGRSANIINKQRFKKALQAAMEFAENPRGWLIFEGPSGSGKTHLTAAIANFRLNKGGPVIYVEVPDLLDHLRSTYNPGNEVTYDELFDQVRQSPLLLLDNFGIQESTSWAQEKLYQIINFRFNAQLPTVIAAAVPVEEMDERFRTRFNTPDLCRRFLLEEQDSPLLGQVGVMALELISHMTFENYDYKRVNLPVEQSQNLERAFRLARSFAESPDGWLVFYGTNGCGKTHLAAAIANYQIRMGRPVFFVIVPDFLDHLRSTFSPDSKVTYDELFERIKKSPLLVLDDFGEQSTTQWAREKLYQLINYRYNARLPMVITTCTSIDEIETRISSRMADPRISLIFTITAPDYRIDRQVTDKAKVSRRSRRQ